MALAFYTGLGASEPWINRMTAYVTGKYMHVELVFVDGARTLACGVWQGEHVFLRPKTFGKTCWEWRALALRPDQVRTVYAFCARQAHRKCPFNRAGLWRSLTPFPRPNPDGDTWFCSELCVAALQTVGLLLDEVPSACTPTAVYAGLDRAAAYHAGSPLVDARIRRRPLTYRRRRLRR